MRIFRVLLLLLSTALGVFSLAIFLSVLPTPDAASAADQPQTENQPTLQRQAHPEPPDPRWMELMRQGTRSPEMAQDDAISMNIDITHGYIAGHVPSALPVEIKVVHQEIEHIITVYPFPDPTGYLYIGDSESIYCSSSYCSSGPFMWGDILWVTQGNHAISMTVPALTGYANPVNEFIYGSAPPRSSISIYLYPYNAANTNYITSTQSTISGTYNVDLGLDINLWSGDSGYILYRMDPNRQAFTYFVAPMIRAQLDGVDISGFAPPYSWVTITRTNATGELILRDGVSADSNGAYIFYDPFPRPYTLDIVEPPAIMPGENLILSAAGQTFSMTVQDISIRSDIDHGIVYGVAPSGKQVDIYQYEGPLPELYYLSMLSNPPKNHFTITSTGQFSLSLPLQPADFGSAAIMDTIGHQSMARYAVPYISVRLGSPFLNYLYGQVDDQWTPITISVRGPSHYLKDYFNTWVGGYGHVLVSSKIPFETSSIIESGDVITLETNEGIQLDLVVAEFTAIADVPHSIVFGKAPPGARLTVRAVTYDWPYPFPPYPYIDSSSLNYSQVVTATANGDYLADFSAQGELTFESSIWVDLKTAEGYDIQRSIKGRPLCPISPISIYLGSNWISIISDRQCHPAIFRLITPGNQVLYQRTLQPGHSGMLELYDPLYQPIPILPGYRIEIETDGQTTTTQVPDFEVNIDPQAGMISGIGPPAGKLEFWIGRQFPLGNDYYTGTVDANGTYGLLLSGGHPLKTGDRIKVTLHQGPIRYVVNSGIPYISARLFKPYQSAWLPPLTPYTYTQFTNQEFISRSGIARPSGDVSVWLNRLIPDDVLRLTTPNQVLSITLPVLTARIDRDIGILSGAAPPNTRLWMSITKIPYSYPSRDSRLEGWITSTINGNYSTTISQLFPLDAAQGTIVYFDTRGNQASISFGTPHLEITLGSYCLNGFANVWGSPYSITHISHSGSLSETVGYNSSSNNGSYGACFSEEIEVGDQLIIIEDGNSSIFQLPLLSAYYDYTRKVLEGHAPPGSEVMSYFTLPWISPLIRHTKADPNGNYGFDTSDLNLVFRSYGRVEVTDSSGNVIEANFQIQGNQFYIPLILSP